MTSPPHRLGYAHDPRRAPNPQTAPISPTPKRTSMSSHNESHDDAVRADAARAHDSRTDAARAHAPSTDNNPAPPPAVRAKDIELSADEGQVFGPLTFTIPSRGLTVLRGRSGSGRTALALCLAGRMKLSAGELEVLGVRERGDIAKRVAVAGIEQIDALDRDVTLRVVATEHRAWSKPWAAWVPKADEDYLRSLCAEIYGPRPLPPLDAYIAQLTSLDRILIRIALALAPTHRTPVEMLIMDDFDQVREPEDREVLLTSLLRLTERFPVVVNAVGPLPHFCPDDVVEIELNTDLHHLELKEATR